MSVCASSIGFPRCAMSDERTAKCQQLETLVLSVWVCRVTSVHLATQQNNITKY